jgi:galactose-6-phosphate isomerase
VPDVDVSDVILDAAVAGEQFAAITRTESVNQFGESSVTVTSATGWGSIGPIGDNSVIREESYDAQAKTIRVITTTFLTGGARVGGVSYKPSVVLWNGNYYQVKAVEDFSSYGVGFVAADCVMTDYEPTPTVSSPPLAGQLDMRLPRSVSLSGGPQCL